MIKKEVILLGRGQSWRDCPFDKECWAVASVLNMPEINPCQIQKVFAFDDYDSVRGEKQIAERNQIPMVSTQSYASEQYPLQEIVSKFGKSYFMPTISYMIAYAIFKDYQKLYLYGIDQSPEWVHLVNKPFVMFWLGIATGNHVEWELSKYSILLETGGDEIRKHVIALKERVSQLKRGLTIAQYIRV